jgi:hypothetical protein
MNKHTLAQLLHCKPRKLLHRLSATYTPLLLLLPTLAGTTSQHQPEDGYHTTKVHTKAK